MMLYKKHFLGIGKNIENAFWNGFMSQFSHGIWLFPLSLAAGFIFGCLL